MAFENQNPVRHAAFAVGELVHHKLFGYRGVVLDIDPQFQGTHEWYEQVARSRPPKDRPWYHVLVDGGRETYVAERNLEPDTVGTGIDHPLIKRYFTGFGDGRYDARKPTN
jgi:heat shock protein HspQ